MPRRDNIFHAEGLEEVETIWQRRISLPLFWTKHFAPYELSQDEQNVFDADELKRGTKSGTGVGSVSGTTVGKGFNGTVSAPQGINVPAPQATPVTTEG
jgi:hypothetical protein